MHFDLPLLLCVCPRFYYVFCAFTPHSWPFSYQFKTKKLEKASSHVSQAAVVLQGVQNFDARLPLQGIGQQQAAAGTQHRSHALDEELGFFEGGARLDAEDEVEGILGKRGRGPTKIPSGNLT